MTTERGRGGRPAPPGRPPRLLLAVHRPSLERLLQRRDDCRVVAVVRDADALRAHLRPEVADVLIWTTGFLRPEEAARVRGEARDWPVARIPAGLPRRPRIVAAAADRLLAAWIAAWLRRGSDRVQAPTRNQEVRRG